MAHTPGSHRHSVVGAVNPCANMGAEGVARALGLAAKAPLGPARSRCLGATGPAPLPPHGRSRTKVQACKAGHGRPAALHRTLPNDKRPNKKRPLKYGAVRPI